MTTLQDIAPSKLKPHPRNLRTDVGDVTELAASIREKGIIEPLIVAPNLGTTYTLLAGHRRLAAAKEAKCMTVPCLVRDDLTDPAEQLETMLVENLQRTDLTPLEEASAYQTLLEFPGYTMKKITQTTGRSASTVKSRIALTKLPEQTRAKIQNGQLNLADAVAITEFASSPETVARLSKAAGTHDFRWQLEEAKRVKAAATQVIKTRKALDAAGITILDRQPAYDERALFLREDERGEHADCGGLVAWINQRSGMAGYACTKPDLHPTDNDDEQDSDDPAAVRKPPADETPQEKEKRTAAEKARAELDQLRADLKVAATVRREHLAEIIHRGNTDIARETLLRLTTYCASTATAFAMQILGLDYDETAAPADNDAAIAAEFTELDVAQLAITLDVLLNANLDGDLEIPTGWGGSYGDTSKGWRHRLGTLYAYEWSQIELDQLEKHEDEQGPLSVEEAQTSDAYEVSDLHDAIDEHEDAG